MKVGEFLRKERELRGMTLDEISASTKVNTRFLEAIETGESGVLPAKAFAKGFLRSYARMVGLDEDLVLTNFEYAQHTIQTGETAVIRLDPPAEKRQHRLLFFMLFLIIMLLTALIILYYQGQLPLYGL
jgi:cytoskeleton protein RodZ